MKDEHGSILIVALWGMIIFSVMAISLTFHASQNILMMKRDANELKVKTDFLSAFNVALEEIRSDPYAHEDSRHDAWYGKVKLPAPFAAQLELEIEDEESKINLNYATRRLLETFLKKFESEIAPLKGERKDYVKQILQLRSQKRIQSLEELLLMEDFKPEDYAELQPFFTVYPELAQININTASTLVIESLIESIPADEAEKKLLEERLLQGCREIFQDCYFLNTELIPEAFAEKLKLAKTPLMMSLIQEFLAAVTTDSENFKAHLKHKLGQEIIAIFHFGSGQIRPEINSWNEL